MKYKILGTEIVGNNIQVAISHEGCVREVFGFPISMNDNNKFLDEINRILSKRLKEGRPKLDTKIYDKEFEVNSDGKAELKYPSMEEVQAKKKELSWQEFVAWAEGYGIKAKSEKEAVELFKQKINAAEL